MKEFLGARVGDKEHIRIQIQCFKENYEEIIRFINKYSKYERKKRITVLVPLKLVSANENFRKAIISAIARNEGLEVWNYKIERDRVEFVREVICRY